ncbi:MAG TPA: hypothetical protein VHB46_19605 [Burkholderiales bacterium]|nr:hypothetical protein [Burkholderiales bacterium]
MNDPNDPGAESADETAAAADASAEIRTWWKRSPALAASAALAIGLGTLWFANMLGRVPIDSSASIGYLLMLPLLLIVPAFSAAALRLCWIAARAEHAWRGILGVVVVAATAANIMAMGRFIQALLRIFGA